MKARVEEHMFQEENLFESGEFVTKQCIFKIQLQTQLRQRFSVFVFFLNSKSDGNYIETNTYTRKETRPSLQIGSLSEASHC